MKRKKTVKMKIFYFKCRSRKIKELQQSIVSERIDDKQKTVDNVDDESILFFISVVLE